MTTEDPRMITALAGMLAAWCSQADVAITAPHMFTDGGEVERNRLAAQIPQMRQRFETLAGMIGDPQTELAPPALPAERIEAIQAYINHFIACPQCSASLCPTGQQLRLAYDGAPNSDQAATTEQIQARLAQAGQVIEARGPALAEWESHWDSCGRQDCARLHPFYAAYEHAGAPDSPLTRALAAWRDHYDGCINCTLRLDCPAALDYAAQYRRALAHWEQPELATQLASPLEQITRSTAWRGYLDHLLSSCAACSAGQRCAIERWLWQQYQRAPIGEQPELDAPRDHESSEARQAYEQHIERCATCNAGRDCNIEIQLDQTYREALRSEHAQRQQRQAERRRRAGMEPST